jgi:hypothetical protein
LTEPDFEEGRSATASDGDRVWDCCRLVDV